MNKLVLQPNGKFARWSDKANHFTHYNLDIPAYTINKYNWISCLETIQDVHNLDERERAERFGNES